MAEETTSTVATTQNATEAASTGATATEATNTSVDTNGASQAAQNASVNLEELIQKAVDRATNKLGNENKKLRSQLEEVRKAKLSDDELKQLEMQEKEKELAEKEQQIIDKEHRLFALEAIKEIGLDDGGKNSLALVDFVMAADEATITERVKAFDDLVKRFVQAEVDRTFKQSGRTPGVGTSTGSTTKENDSIATRLGQNAAKANKAAQDTINYYLGGKK